MFLIRRDAAQTAQVEALARYVDHLVAGEPTTPDETIGELAEVARAVRADLPRLEPPEQFQAELRLRLIAAADQRAHPEDMPAVWRQPRFIIGAASLVSAAAVIALMARSRLQARPAA